MRIIAGQLRGLRLATLGKGDPGAHLRPTPDRVRESLFSLLDHRGAIAGAVVLDLFAGTGALGLEALSRGAARVTFVENGRTGQRLIAENIARARAQDTARLIRVDCLRLASNQGSPANLVFLDPPYGAGLGESALTSAQRGDWIAPGAVIVWEENAAQTPPEGFTRLDHRRYGDTHVTVLEYDG